MDMNLIQMNSYPNADGPSAAYSCLILLISIALIV